ASNKKAETTKTHITATTLSRKGVLQVTSLCALVLWAGMAHLPSENSKTNATPRKLSILAVSGNEWVGLSALAIPTVQTASVRLPEWKRPRPGNAQSS